MHKVWQKVYVNPHKETVFFSVNADGMSIEQYFKHVATYAYVDVDFYAIEDISTEFLKILGVRENIAVNENRTSGEYYTGNPGRQPDWNTSGDFHLEIIIGEVGCSFGIHFCTFRGSGFNGKIQFYFPLFDEK